MAVRQWIGRHLRELNIHRRRLARPGRGLRRAIGFVSDLWTGGSGDLRARALEPELEEFGWRLICLPTHLSLAQRRRILALDKPDLIFLQQSRHPLNRPRLYPGLPIVFDADDSDFLDPLCTEAVFECCRESTAIVAGSRFLAESFRPLNPNVVVVWTGSYLRPTPGSKPADEREPVVTWASASPMKYPVEAKLVREVIIRLAGRTRFTFRLYGISDEERQAAEEYLEPIREAGVPVQVHSPMPYVEFVRSLESATVGLQPVCLSNPFSRGKSFGKLLGYLASGVAIVTSDAVDHPLFFRDGVTAMLVGDDVDAWVDRTERLLNDPGLLRRMTEAARPDFLRELTTTKAAEQVARQFDRAMEIAAEQGRAKVRV